LCFIALVQVVRTMTTTVRQQACIGVMMLCSVTGFVLLVTGLLAGLFTRCSACKPVCPEGHDDYDTSGCPLADECDQAYCTKFLVFAGVGLFVTATSASSSCTIICGSQATDTSPAIPGIGCKRFCMGYWCWPCRLGGAMKMHWQRRAQGQPQQQELAAYGAALPPAPWAVAAGPAGGGAASDPERARLLEQHRSDEPGAGRVQLWGSLD